MKADHDHVTWRAGAVIACAVAATGAFADDHDARTVAHFGPTGTSIEQTSRLAPAPAAHEAHDAAAPASPVGADGIVWGRNLGAAIFTTTGISIPGASLAAATYLNAPKEVELVPLDGAGTPTWTSPGTQFSLAVSTDANVIAAADAAGGDVIVSKWTTASGTPDWSYTIEGVNLATARTMAVSPDGSTIAALVNIAGSRAVLYYFDAGSPSPLGVIDADSGTFARNVAISADGRYIAFMAGAIAYVADRDTDTIRFSINAGATNDAISISGDGTYLAYGWTTLSVRQWNGTTYAPLWTRSISGNMLRACAASRDGTTLATAWGTFSATQPRVEVHAMASSTPEWTYVYQPTEGSLQEIASDVAVTVDGSHLAVSSWGNAENNNPEVHVFARGQSSPILTVDTPGSMFDIDIAAEPGGVVRVAACGKHIHANDFGSGGDLYSIRIGADCAADIDGDGDVGFSDLLSVLTFWGPCAGCPEDVDGDGEVGFTDLLAVLSGWGPC